MITLHFIASNRFDLGDFKNINKFVGAFPDFQTLTLNNENELLLLLDLIEVKEVNSQERNELKFSKYWDLSAFVLPELNEEQFK